MNTLSHNSSPLYEYLSKLDKAQLKAFYGMLVHYWVNQKAFISKHNFFNLWCELNVLCHEVDEGFPDINDHELVKSYCHEHPYYFIDILPLEYKNDVAIIESKGFMSLPLEGSEAARAQ